MATKANLAALHKKSRNHKSSLYKGRICGCFYCFAEYPFEQIAEWIDADRTALCPRCGVDAVLGFDTPAADQELLHAMHERWFGTRRHLTPGEWNEAVERDVWPPAPGKPARET
jgi:hypothetical protein